MAWQPKTGARCACKRGIERDNCPTCEGTGWEIDFARIRRACPCGSRLERHELVDARGIFCAYVCEQCEPEVRKRYRSDIFTDPDYWHDEPIEEDE